MDADKHYKNPLNRHWETAPRVESKMLYGIKAVAEYMKMNPSTLWRWEAELGFPLVETTRGRVMTSTGAIDLWLVAYHRAQNELKRKDQRYWSAPLPTSRPEKK